MSKKHATILITALLTSLSFLLILAAGFDPIFLSLSTLPLFAIGLSQDPRIVLKAGALATLPIAVITSSPAVILMYYFAFALPCWYICDMALHSYDLKLKNATTPMPTLRLWYPIGLITLHMAVYGCAVLAVVTAIVSTQDTSLPQQLSTLVHDSVTTLNKEYNVSINLAERDLSFMICGLIVWLWTAILLGNGWLTNRSLVKKKLAKRPSFAITPFPVPNWLLTFMGICALASLIGGESMRFLGKSSLIILMLPYFFQGLALLHISTINWPNRRVFLCFMYFIMVVLFWPTLMVAAIGLWDHIKILNKRLSGSGTSSKS